MIIPADEDDLRDVISAVVDLAKRWQELGVSLRLRQDDLKAILTNNPDSCDNCLREMLILWLGQKYKVQISQTSPLCLLLGSKFNLTPYFHAKLLGILGRLCD